MRLLIYAALTVLVVLVVGVYLPMVVGILSDLSGTSKAPLPKLKDRKFVEINPDNFDAVLKSTKPRVNFAVENKLQPGGGKIAVDMTFESMDDFSPDAVAQRVGPLKELLDLRTKLADLRGSLQGNDKLEEILQHTLNDAAAMKKLEGEIGQGGGNG